MPTPIQRRAITEDLNPNWDAAEHALRSAMEVIDWCVNEHINLAGLEARDLHTAMGEMPPEHQRPTDFLDVACALAAALPKGVLQGAAPDLLAACKAQHQAIDTLFAMLITLTKDQEPHCFFPSESGQPWEALVQGNAAIAKATQVSP